jgi:hypothetical protein
MQDSLALTFVAHCGPTAARLGGAESGPVLAAGYMPPGSSGCQQTFLGEIGRQNAANHSVFRLSGGSLLKSLEMGVGAG